MKDTAFLMGQFLKVIDELPALYGGIVCDNVPHQLAGASMLVAASDTPDKALTQLCIRMAPYIAWAKSYRYENIKEAGKESWRARWLLSMFETISEQLHETFIKPIRFNDFDRAQLFLGYLAKFPKRESDENPTESDLDSNERE